MGLPMQGCWKDVSIDIPYTVEVPWECAVRIGHVVQWQSVVQTAAKAHCVAGVDPGLDYPLLQCLQ